MKPYFSIGLMAALCAPAFGQVSADAKPSPFPPAPPAVAAALADTISTDLDMAKINDLNARIADKNAEMADRVAEMNDKAAAMQDKIAAIADRFADGSEFADKFKSKFEFKFDDNFNVNVATDVLGRMDMAFLQSPKAAPSPAAAPAPPMPPKGPAFRTGRDNNGEYDAGTRALDQHRYEEAAQHFSMVIDGKSSRSDGALYWKAYALNRAGKREEALASIAQLRRDFTGSPWLNDAQALEAEVKQNAGQPISPQQESNEDLKLMAINSLMNADADRAIPLVEGILKGNSAPNVKDRALFVLSQNRTPRAQTALAEYAKGGTNPDLQVRAIQYMGMSGAKDNQQMLVTIYNGSSDTRVRNTVLQALMQSRGSDALLSIARTEKEPNLRNSAIRGMMQIRSTPTETLMELYGSSDMNTKREMIDGFQNRNDAKTLVDLARKETDPQMKKTLVERLGNMHNNKEAMDYMIELLK